MNMTYLEKAKLRVSDIPTLINMVSRRVRQLNLDDQRPMVKPDSPQMERMDLALKEIAEGKLAAEALFTAEDLKNQAHPSSISFEL
jgi:DNA-directed RNA polymerase omega subunit